MKQVLIGGYVIDLGVIVMSVIAKIKPTMHKLGISFKSLLSLARVKTNQNGKYSCLLGMK